MKYIAFALHCKVHMFYFPMQWQFSKGNHGVSCPAADKEARGSSESSAIKGQIGQKGGKKMMKIKVSVNKKII